MFAKGAQYKYVAEVSMLPFAEAPKAIKKALGRLTWACTFALGLLHVTDYEKPNELLAVGYKEGNEMGVSLGFCKRSGRVF